MLPVFYLWLDALCSPASIDKHALPYETLKNGLLLAPSLRSSKPVDISKFTPVWQRGSMAVTLKPRVPCSHAQPYGPDPPYLDGSDTHRAFNAWLGMAAWLLLLLVLYFIRYACLKH